MKWTSAHYFFTIKLLTKDPLIIRTQLIPPSFKKNILRRERLLKILYQNLDKKLMLLTASAGYGKTTLLAQFVDKLKSPFVFYTISKSSSDLSTFIAYLITGIGEIYKGFGTRTRSLIERIEDSEEDLEMLIGTFANELLDSVDKELFIILEDYHLLRDNKVINRALDYLLERMPLNVHFIISSRVEPSLSIAKIRAKDELLELASHPLRFTSDEIKVLFRKVYKLDIDEFLIKEIHRYSECWVTALQLISYIIEKSPKDVLNRLKYGKENFDYFTSEVFEQQSKRVRAFLVKSCILERISAASCDTVLERSDSHEILSVLVKKNLGS